MTTDPSGSEPTQLGGTPHTTEGDEMSAEPFDVQAARARCEAATEGPWDWFDTGTGHVEMYVPNGTMNTETVLNFVDHLDCEECTRPARADAEFISHARMDLPAALDALGRVRTVVERYRDYRGGFDQIRQERSDLADVIEAALDSDDALFAMTGLRRAAVAGPQS